MEISVKFDPTQCNTLRREHGMPELDTNTINNQALFPARKTIAVADTGASVDCSGIDILNMLGIGRRVLLPTSTILRTANKQILTVLGTIPVTVSTKSVDKETVVTERVLMYVVKELKSIFLSKDTLVEMSVIPPYFPMPPPRRKYGEVAGLKGTSTDTTQEEECLPPRNLPGAKAKCGCPMRTPAPAPPKLPFPATEENRDKLETFLAEYYSSSTFNTCNHQPLPLMHGEPLKLHLQEGAIPHAIHVPPSIPVHWKGKVMDAIKQDVALGVLEKVPPNTPSTWCHRLVITRKHNGEPRRTVDLKKLNDVCVRQTHPTEPPFKQAMSVPHGVKKSTLDAWNGYHSVAIREEDRHLTTFLTPEGRFRYRTAPQGFLASGDGYTHRYDEITKNVDNIKRVIDDTLLYAKTLEDAFHQVAKYLELAGNNGIILNPEKFNLGKDVVDWAGVRITQDGIEPLPEHIEAIKNFPVPENITDMRSYWALVNQVSNYYATQPHLAPFRELMKKNTKWYWDDVLQQLFEQSRTFIADRIQEGIIRYDTTKWTAVMTDWSRQGIGFVMCQKYCSCPTITPLCCKGGWKVCMVGSSFLSPAEQNYSPIEGEGLAVVNALHKTRHYTQGCDKLLVCTDHKPLVPVMSTKTLENIENPRLMRLVQKTLSWRFLIIHIPGKLLAGPDTLSRVPRQPGPRPAGAWGSVSSLVLEPTSGPSLDGALQEEEEQHMDCKEARIHIKNALRINSTMPG